MFLLFSYISLEQIDLCVTICHTGRHITRESMLSRLKVKFSMCLAILYLKPNQNLLFSVVSVTLTFTVSVQNFRTSIFLL